MSTAITGLLHDGNVITLDQTIPPLEGRRIRVMIEPLEDEEKILAGREQAEYLRQWAEEGPQGPIEDDGSADFPWLPGATSGGTGSTAPTRDARCCCWAAERL